MTIATEAAPTTPATLPAVVGRVKGWEHRVLRHDHDRLPPAYCIHEVYYDEAGNPVMYTEDPIPAVGEDLDSLALEHGRMVTAFTKPVLTKADFPTILPYTDHDDLADDLARLAEQPIPADTPILVRLTEAEIHDLIAAAHLSAPAALVDKLRAAIPTPVEGIDPRD